MIFTCFCGTILIACMSTYQDEQHEDAEDDRSSCRYYLQNDAVGADDADLRASGKRRRCRARPSLRRRR